MTHIPFKVSLLRLVFLLLPVTVAAQEARLYHSGCVNHTVQQNRFGRTGTGIYRSLLPLWYGETIARLHCPSQ